MAIIKRYNPNNLFFSERLINKLETIYTHSLTIIEAPTGFGKTTAVRHLLEESTDPVVWFHIDNDDKTKFFHDLYAKIKGIDEESYNKLRVIQYPLDEENCVKIANILIDLNVDKNTIFVIDNYHYVSDDALTKIFLDVTSNDKHNFRVVLLTQVIDTDMLFDITLKNKVNYIDSSNFALSKEEIIAYCRNCGVRLEEEEADFLYRYTEGWISAVYLQVVNYAETGKFFINASIDKLIEKALWDKLSNTGKEFLTSIGIFQSFTFRQALYIANGKISEEKVKAILGSTGLISYDSKERKYYIHSLLHYFLLKEFHKLETVFRNQIYAMAGKWFAENEEYMKAITYFYRYKDYESIFKMNHDADVIIQNANAQNKEMFMNIVLRTPYEVKKKYPRASVVYLFVLFVYNDRECLLAESRLIMDIINESTEFIERQKKILIGEIYYCRALCEYNDLQKMKDLYIEAYAYLKSPSTIIGKESAWTLGVPSVLCSYHRDSGMAMEELEVLESSMPYYYKLSDGHGKGGEALMKAEILFMRGELEGAELLCQKTLYMAETRNQISIYVAAMFLLARIAVFSGEYDTMTEIVEAMGRKIEKSKDKLTIMTQELSRGYLAALVENVSKIPGWLHSDITIEEKCSITALGFANIIYGKYLILTENYNKLLGISGQFLGISNIYSNVIYKVYTYIYISIANFQMNNQKKALKFIEEALSLSVPDGFFIPFVENFKYISEILPLVDEKYQYFTGKIRESEKIHYNILKVSKMSIKNNLNYGLTVREYTVAKLAAARLTNKEIAEKLFIAESTVKSNMKVIFNKLSITSRSELSKFF